MKIGFLILIFLFYPHKLYAESSSEPLRLFCKTQYLSCSDGKCWQFLPKWLFTLKAFSAHTSIDEWYIDFKKNEVFYNGDLSTTRFSISETPEIIFLTGYNSLDVKSTKVMIDRKTGEILQEEIHTDGTIEEIPIGEDYGQIHGYCEKKLIGNFKHKLTNIHFDRYDCVIPN